MMPESDLDHRPDRRPRQDPAVALASVAATLPPGWLCLQDCDISGVSGRPVPLHYVLLHADIGVALLDIAPATTQGAEATLRRRLEAARFAGIFPGHLPIVHLRIAADEVDGLAMLLEQAFATLPPLSVGGGDAWVSVVSRALSPRDPARGAAYRGVYLDDWSAAPHSPPPDRSHRDEAPDSAQLDASRSDVARPDATRTGAPRLMGGWSGDAQHEDFAAEDQSPRRPRWAWVALGAGGLALLAVLVTVMMAGGRPTAEAPQPSQAARVPAAGMAALPTGTTLPGVSPAPVGMASATREAPAARVVELAAPVPPSRDGGATVQTLGQAQAGANGAARPAEAQAAPPQDQAARVVVTSAVNIRTGPNKSFGVLRTAPRGQSFRVFGRAPGNWFQVGEAQPEGWLFGDMVREVRP